MLAATDPAAIIAVFSRLRAPRRLTALIEAESLFNDGTGIVIFAIAVECVRARCRADRARRRADVTTVFVDRDRRRDGLRSTTRVLRRLDDHLIELTISLVAAYGSYLLAERFDQSGILATVACGLVFGSLGRRATSARAEDAIDTVWEFIAFLMTTIVFLLIGLAVSIPQLADAFVPSLVALVGVLVSRALVVYGLLGVGSRAMARIGWALGDAQQLAAPDRVGRAARRDRRRAGVVVASGHPAARPAAGVSCSVASAHAVLQGTTAEPLVRWLGIEVVDEAPRERR